MPDAGDLVWVDFSPQAGHEQGGKRPAIVLSDRSYNSVSGLMVACPVTSRAKGYPFEVVLPPKSSVTGCILADHLKSLDWRARNTSFIEVAPDGLMNEVLAKVSALVNLN